VARSCVETLRYHGAEELEAQLQTNQSLELTFNFVNWIGRKIRRH